ncbi:hypothetical protein Pmar_PMAR020164 [Perkinsus marinus ATCC 50983]|uniref:C3H1-type domain-containing protein n=1 Tax=Perkinsus marinus (strain ATCC 50983 / TXsc) TaxID=423536 RepID=C5LPU0_PERM5|nr:hypothetical protein Pmar_PMAR020164 [Perkinsus marinus ATCC 50983]EER01258.1 hypothetical protein Pmar_PMAR020164 [Perkinsus marinus ATCC 50983]|eukprot:XP_002768540.1 hypothetical protein Pmar_PMAR020164 [Perkinsus marinus ATCC 50983]
MDTATTATPLHVCESDDPNAPKEEPFTLPPAYDPEQGSAPQAAPVVTSADVSSGEPPQMSDVVKRLLKTRFCRYGDHCKYGARCFYAHSPEELRQRPPPPPGYRKGFPQGHTAPFPPEHMAAMVAFQDPMMGYQPPLGFLPEAMAQLMAPMGDLRMNMMPYGPSENSTANTYGYDNTAPGAPQPAQVKAPVVGDVPGRMTVSLSHSGMTAAQIANLLEVASSTAKATEK